MLEPFRLTPLPAERRPRSVGQAKDSFCASFCELSADARRQGGRHGTNSPISSTACRRSAPGGATPYGFQIPAPPPKNTKHWVVSWLCGIPGGEPPEAVGVGVTSRPRR